MLYMNKPLIYVKAFRMDRNKNIKFSVCKCEVEIYGSV